MPRPSMQMHVDLYTVRSAMKGYSKTGNTQMLLRTPLTRQREVATLRWHIHLLIPARLGEGMVVATAQLVAGVRVQGRPAIRASAG